MSKELLSMLAIQALLLFIVIIVLAFIFKLNRIIRYEKRISKFALSNKSAKEASYLDRFTEFCHKIIVSIAMLIEKSKYVSKLTKRYTKYDLFNGFKYNSEYLVVRLFSGLGVGVVIFFVCFIQNMEFTWLCVIGGLILGYLIPSMYWDREYKNYTDMVTSNMLEAIIVVNSAIRDGSTVMGGIKAATSQLTGPISIEFKKVSADLKYGLSLDQAFDRLYFRIKHESVKYICDVLMLYKKINGNYQEAFRKIENELYEDRNNDINLRTTNLLGNILYKAYLVLPIIVLIVIFLIKSNQSLHIYMSIQGCFVFSFMILIYLMYIYIMTRLFEVR